MGDPGEELTTSLSYECVFLGLSKLRGDTSLVDVALKTSLTQSTICFVASRLHHKIHYDALSLFQGDINLDHYSDESKINVI